tara:strand:+ start:198 stop:974 length:777 start_codon:yes stop_codon:yes gene_type:complete
MEIIINNPNHGLIFATLFQHMKLFTENMNIHFNPEGIYIQAMDNSHVSILEINLPNHWFDKYDVNDSVIIGINTTILFKVLNTKEDSHNVRIYLESPTSDKLDISLVSEDSKVFDKHYEIPLIDIDNELMTVPDMEYQVEMSLSSVTFSTLIEQMKMFGSDFSISCSEENVQMSSQSQETGKMSVNVPIDDLSSYAIDEGETIDMSFSLSHLKNICLYSKISKDIDIYLKTEFPIKLVYLLDSEQAKATFYLAPKIQD